MPTCSALQESLRSYVLQEEHSQRFLMPLVLFSYRCLHSTSHVFAPCLPIPHCYNPLTSFGCLSYSSGILLSWFWCIQVLTVSVGLDFVDQEKKFLWRCSCCSLHSWIPTASSKYSELELANILGDRKSPYVYFLYEVEVFKSTRKFRNIVSLWETTYKNSTLLWAGNIG